MTAIRNGILIRGHLTPRVDSYSPAVVDLPQDSTTLAVRTEQRLFGDVTVMDGGDLVGMGKTLLVRPTAKAWPCRRTVRLVPAITEVDWAAYAEHRISVEAGFGVSEHQARSMVRTLRERNADLGLALYLAFDARQVVGAIARFRLPAPDHHVARLQDVDVFPSWRGRGYGDAVLHEMFRLLGREGSTLAIVGGDEDDWPLGWYRRRGFCDVARVPLTR